MPDKIYRNLIAWEIHDTASRLHQRILRRFPEAGLARVCGELTLIANDAEDTCTDISRPNVWLRVGVGTLITLIIAGLLFTILSFDFTAEGLTPADYIQALEAGSNEVVLLGAAIFFLITVEGRLKRAKALRSLHELRAVAHVIDMHQLTKDPESLLEPDDSDTLPLMPLDGHQLAMYLDYCSEMLSLLGKIAALYAQNLNDGVVLNAVTEIEDLTNGLSNKIWQKIGQVRAAMQTIGT